MSRKATASACAQKAMEAVERTDAQGRPNPIRYTEEDCQGFVEATIKRAGGTVKDWRGSNDMFRNACSRIEPLKSAAGKAMLVPGAVLFILKHDGGEPDRYKKDGLGNANHIGWYTGGRYEVVHSSASRGQVAPSTLKNAWTHVGWMNEVDYSEYTAPGGQHTGNEVFIMLYEAQVTGGGLNVREQPAQNSRRLYQLENGTTIRVLEETSPEWARIDGPQGQGYVMRKYLQAAGAYQPGSPADSGPAVVIRCGSLAEAEAIVTILRGAQAQTI